jgi:hypothetical protein
MKFFLGVAIGAVGMWAYTNGKLQGWMGAAPESIQQASQQATQRIGQLTNTDPVRQTAATVQDRVHGAPEIAMPSAAEVSGRPSEPLPSTGA